MRTISMLLALGLALPPVALAGAPELLPELRYSDPDSWLGADRAALLEKWGAPTKFKASSGGELVVFERSFLVGLAYDASSRTIEYTKEKDTDGKSHLVKESAPTAPTDALYKKAKFKFWLDGSGRVVKVKFPSEAGSDPASKYYAAPVTPDPTPTPYTP